MGVSGIAELRSAGMTLALVDAGQRPEVVAISSTQAEITIKHKGTRNKSNRPLNGYLWIAAAMRVKTTGMITSAIIVLFFL